MRRPRRISAPFHAPPRRIFAPWRIVHTYPVDAFIEIADEIVKSAMVYAIKNQRN
jgi:hypothetical protein